MAAEAAKEESTTDLEQKRTDLTVNLGYKSFQQEVLKAEALQICQEILRINNILGERASKATPKPEEPKLVVPDAILPPEAPAPQLSV